MNLFSRLSELLAPSVEEVLGREPALEVATARVLRKAERSLAAARRCAALLFAAGHQLVRELEYHRRRAAFWQTRAREALAWGDGPSARWAAARQAEHDRAAACLEQRQAAVRQRSKNIRRAFRALETSLAEVRRRQGVIRSWEGAAQARLGPGHGVSLEGASTPLATRLEHLWAELFELEEELRAELEAAEVLDVPEGTSARQAFDCW